MSGLVKLDGWRDWWWLGRKVVFELNMTSPCRHIQPVADITYLLKALNLRKKHLPKKDEVLLSQLGCLIVERYMAIQCFANK